MNNAPPLSIFTGWTVITANLIAIIKTCELVQQANIYPYAPAQFTGYPAIVVQPQAEDGLAIDTQRNKYTYRYRIMAVQSRLNLVPGNQNASYAQAEILMQALVDALTDLLNTDITVGGIGSAWSRPISQEWGYIKAQDVDARTCIISMEVVVGQ